MNDACIIVLPKPGKDLLAPESYRPISLLNLDVKILARILATRLSKVMQGWVHPDQSSFIPTRSTAINRRFLNMQLPLDNPGKWAISLLEAFDSVKWTYLWEVLGLFVLGKDLSVWSSYSSHPPGPVCKLMDPFLNSSRYIGVHGRSEAICGFKKGDRNEKVLLYADDALLFLGDMDKSLTSLMSLIHTFGSFLGFAINWNKSILFPLDDPNLTIPEEGGSANQNSVLQVFGNLGASQRGRLPTIQSGSHFA